MITEDSRVRINTRFIIRIIKRPNIGKNKSKEIAGRYFFENRVPKLANQFPELWMIEREKVERELNRHMIMEQLEPGKLGKLIPDRHLADGWWTKDHDKIH